MSESRVLNIAHETRYRFTGPSPYGVYQVRLIPIASAGQRIRDWRLTIDGGAVEAEHTDHHGNRVALASVRAGVEEVAIHARGVIVVEDRAGLVGNGAGGPPLWLYRRQTPLTAPGPALVDLIEASRAVVRLDDVATLHALSAEVLRRMPYDLTVPDVEATAEDALVRGRGVCQDHAHVFVSACRALGAPARYVSGYLMLQDRIDQEAGHAWAEAHVPHLGWVGFDVSNGMSPDARYARLAVGLDYAEAAPVTGLVIGAAKSHLSVAIQVQQQ